MVCPIKSFQPGTILPPFSDTMSRASLGNRASNSKLDQAKKSGVIENIVERNIFVLFDFESKNEEKAK